MVKSGNFGHQVNSDMRLQTVEIQVWAVTSGFSLFAYFFIPVINNETNKVTVRIHLISEVTWLYPNRDILDELILSKRYKLTCALIEVLDQPAHPLNLTIIFDERSGCSQGSNVSSTGNLKFWSHCMDVQTDFNLRCTHMQTWALR